MATDIADYNTFVQNLAAAGHAAIQAYSAGFNVVGCTEDTDARDNTSTTFTNTDKGVPIYWLNGTKAADDYEDFYDGSWDDEANDKAETGVDRLDTSQFNNLPWTGCEHDGTEAFRVFSRALGNSDGNRPVVLLGVPGSNNPQNGPLSSSSAQVPGFQLPVYGLSAVFQVAAEVLINKPPAFPSATAARSVAENTAPGQNVGAALTATDADSHTLTYTLEGTDAASFDIVTAAASARIRTKTGVTYNHEAKSTYTVIVKADDSNGGTATVTVTITVTDVNEPPGRPAAPSVTATVGLSTSLDVTWTAPSNTGPAITSYDLQYRQGTSGPFTAGPQDVPGTSGAIASLAQGTSYEVQVRATNAEGDGEWSFEGTGQPGTTVPDAPTGLVATASGPTKINLSWTAPASDGGFPITGYKIEVSSDGGSSWAGHLATTGNPATTYSHTGLARDTTRHYRVSAINTSGAGTPSNVDDATTTTEVTVPGAPTEFVASSDGTDKINLTWTAPASDGGSAITGYRIEVSSDGGSSWSDHVANTRSTTTTYAHTGLSPGDTRHYRVSAINTIGAGTPSNVDGATTASTRPSRPTGLSATASGNTQINLTWVAPASDGGSPITGYRIEISSDGGSSWTDQVADTTSADTTYSHTGLSPGDTRHYRVSAINTNGAGRPSNVDGATTEATEPGAPTGLSATASGTTQINLTWTVPASDGGSPITGYRIEISSDGGSSWTDQVANTRRTNTTYSHTGLAPGDTRHYRVSAITTSGTGFPSNVDGTTAGTTVPGAPTALVAAASGTTQINLTWTAPAITGGSAITGYKIESSSDGGSSWSDHVANTASTDTTYSHTGLAIGATRHYRVSAINTNGAGLPSNVDNATTGATVPGAPTGLLAIASGNTQINLTWTAPASNGGFAITAYRIEVSSDGGSSWSDHVANTRDTSTTYSDTGLAPGDTRHYRVSAINTNGAGLPSNVDDATTGATALPGAPSVLVATASGTTQINLTWTAPASNGGFAITAYRIEVSSDGGSSWSDHVADTRITTTTYSHTGLAPGTTRHYRVSAINTNGAGPPSNVDDATTDTTVPGAPTGLSATASDTTKINLTWTAPASDGGSAITGYRIEVSSNGGSSWSDRVADTRITTTTYSHTGLSALNDPISDYLPEFKTMHVAVDETSPVNGRRVSYTVPADRQITVRDLFMHTAGLSYQGPKAPDGEPYFAKTGVNSATTLEEMDKRIAKAPLVQQPGTTWQYGYSTDVLARYVEVVSGMPIDAFFSKNIFEPLWMSDTGYYVPNTKWDRFTVLYSLNQGKKTVRRSTAAAQDSYKQPTTKLGGGSGLVSTTMDYARFCQMLANDGELDGVRILSRKSVELMRADHMPLDMPRAGGTISAGWGFGLTFAVNRGPGLTGMIGTEGEYRWGGAAGTRFWIDPKEEMVTIFMVQILPYRGLSYGREFKRLAYQAIVD